MSAHKAKQSRNRWKNIALAVIVAPATREIAGAGSFGAVDIIYTYGSYHINDFNFRGLFTDKLPIIYVYPGSAIHADVEAQ